MFTRNVISFRRGIMNPDTLVMFRDFLKLQHQLNLAQFQACKLVKLLKKYIEKGKKNCSKLTKKII